MNWVEHLVSMILCLKVGKYHRNPAKPKKTLKISTEIQKKKGNKKAEEEKYKKTYIMGVRIK